MVIYNIQRGRELCEFVLGVGEKSPEVGKGPPLSSQQGK